MVAIPAAFGGRCSHPTTAYLSVLPRLQANHVHEIEPDPSQRGIRAHRGLENDLVENLANVAFVLGFPGACRY